MKKILTAISILILGAACASRPHNISATSATGNGASKLVISKSDLVKIDKTIAHVNSEIDELQTLNDKMYEKSLTADPKIEQEFQKKAGEYGSFDSLQADLKLLKAMRSDSQISKAE